MDITEYGWTPWFEASLRELDNPDLIPGRIVREDRQRYRVITAAGELIATLPGRLRHEEHSTIERPAVGDWVAMERRADDMAIIEAVLERTSRIARVEVSRGQDAQVIAANVDFAFLVCGLDLDFNLRRLERYLTLVAESDATPVVVLTKTDLHEDIGDYLNQVHEVARGVSVHAVGLDDDDCLAPILAYLKRGVTAALLGSSGTGKSTLINRLTGEERMLTQEVREEDSRGRHTTSHRELILLAGGGMIVDTPGMRELQLWAAQEDVAATFSDVDAIALNCRFSDCRHASEPGCAVQAALTAGELDADRLLSFQKLMREQARFEAQQDTALQRDARAKRKRFTKMIRKRPDKRDG